MLAFKREAVALVVLRGIERPVAKFILVLAEQFN